MGSHCRTPGRGSRASVSRPLTISEASSAVRAISSNAARLSGEALARAACATVEMAVSGVRSSCAASDAKMRSRSRAASIGAIAARARTYDATATSRTIGMSMVTIVTTTLRIADARPGRRFRRSERRTHERGVFARHECVRAQAERDKNANEAGEIVRRGADDHVVSRYPTPQTVSMIPFAPCFFNLRRSWLT